jgi:hypothetical protein
VRMRIGRLGEWTRGTPRTASWEIFSRPCGTFRSGVAYPGLTSWATLSRPFGTVPIQRDSRMRFANANKLHRKSVEHGVPSRTIGCG